jgi:DNA repair protein RadC
MKEILIDSPDNRLVEVGWGGLSDEELLQLILWPGNSIEKARGMARSLLSNLVSPRKFKSASYADLRERGLNHKQALGMQAGLEFARRTSVRLLPPCRSFRTSLEIYSYFRPRFEGVKKECFWGALLDGKNRIMRVLRVSEGSLTRSLVHPREVFRPAIKEAAAGILFVHNHPSGEPEPSREDIQITQRLVEGGRLLGIRVLDHVIIGSCRYFSFADEGML